MEMPLDVAFSIMKCGDVNTARNILFVCKDVSLFFRHHKNFKEKFLIKNYLQKDADFPCFPNGLKHGTRVLFYSTGKPSSEETYFYGKQHGKKLSWDKDGDLTLKEYYTNGKIEKRSEWKKTTMGAVHLQFCKTKIKTLFKDGAIIRKPKAWCGTVNATL